MVVPAVRIGATWRIRWIDLRGGGGRTVFIIIVATCMFCCCLLFFGLFFFIFNDLRQTDYISKSTGSIFAKFSWFVELWRLRTVKSASDSLDTGEPIN